MLPKRLFWVCLCALMLHCCIANSCLELKDGKAMFAGEKCAKFDVNTTSKNYNISFSVDPGFNGNSPMKLDIGGCKDDSGGVTSALGPAYFKFGKNKEVYFPATLMVNSSEFSFADQDGDFYQKHCNVSFANVDGGLSTSFSLVFDRKIKGLKMEFNKPDKDASTEKSALSAMALGLIIGFSVLGAIFLIASVVVGIVYSVCRRRKQKRDHPEGVVVVKTSKDKREETPKVENEEAPKADAKNEEAPKETPKEEAPKADVKNEEALKETPKETPKVDTKKKETPKVDTKEEETPKADTKKEETPKADTKKEEKPKVDKKYFKDEKSTLTELNAPNEQGTSQPNKPPEPTSQDGAADPGAFLPTLPQDVAIDENKGKHPLSDSAYVGFTKPHLAMDTYHSRPPTFRQEDEILHLYRNSKKMVDGKVFGKDQHHRYIEIVENLAPIIPLIERRRRDEVLETQQSSEADADKDLVTAKSSRKDVHSG